MIDEGRYTYLGDRASRYYRPQDCGATVDAVLFEDGRVVRGRNRNQLVRFEDGRMEVVPGRFLRRR